MMHYCRLALCLSSLTIVVACSNGSRALSPTAPSGGGPTVANINGTQAAGTGQPSTSLRMNAFSAGAPLLSGHVEGEGAVSSVVLGTVCPARSFVIEGFTIKVTATTTFAGGSCTDIAVGVKLGVKGDVAPDGSVTATSIVVKKDDTVTTLVDGDGTVSSLVTGTTCPALSFVVEGHTVKTDATTTFEGGVCADIKPGTKVGVHGKSASDGTVTATRVVIKKEDNTGKFVEGDGEVSSLVTGTSCPALSFMVETHKIVTSASTTFQAGVCADIQPGSKLMIQGTLASDGSVTATRLVLKGNHPTEVEGETVIASLIDRTSCPTLSFIVEGHTVTTTPTTVYSGGVCVDAKAGVRVQVKGLMTSDGSVTATAITFKAGEGPKTVEGSGKVSSASGTCPTLQFVVQGFTVKTDATTQFINGLCSAVAIGKDVEVKGSMVAGVVQASSVRF